MPRSLNLLVADLFSEIWQRFSLEFEESRYSGSLVEWRNFYIFAGRQSLSKPQARLLAAAWQEQRKVFVRKHGLRFTVGIVAAEAEA